MAILFLHMDVTNSKWNAGKHIHFCAFCDSMLGLSQRSTPTFADSPTTFLFKNNQQGLLFTTIICNSGSDQCC